MYPCVESTAEFVERGMRIRIWRNEDPDPDHVKSRYDNADMRELVGHLAFLHEGDPASVAVLVAEQPRINAVQVQDIETGEGLVIYVEWP
jgi:hypothetical protein